MKKLFFAGFVLLAFISNLYGQTQKELKTQFVSMIVGEWINIDTNKGDVTRIIITNDRNELSIEAFGRCHPTDCEWGKVKLHCIAASAFSDDNLIPFDYLIAIWEIEGEKPNAITEIMKITIKKSHNPKLYIENISLFNDNSGRSDCYSNEIMTKK